MQRRWLGILLGCACGLMVCLLVDGSVSEADPAAGDALIASTGGSICEQVYTGTMQSVYRVCSTYGITIAGQEAVSYPTYRVQVTPPKAPCITITVTSRPVLSSSASYPLRRESIPADVQVYLNPEDGYIESDNPSIVALASELTHGMSREDQAVASIIAWVRSHIIYNEAAQDNSSLRVLETRTGTDQGFYALTAALLRAAGIPARELVTGILNYSVLGTSWSVPAEGDFQYCVLIYYPGLGWVPSDPQRTINWIDTAHIASPFALLGVTDAFTSTRASHSEDVTLTEQLTHIYADTVISSGPLYSAENTNGSLTLDWSPKTILLALSRTQPATSLTLTVASLRCDSAWELTSAAAWLTPTITAGSARMAVRLDIDAGSLPTGFTTTYLTLSTADASGLPAIARMIPVTVLLGDPLCSIHLPLVSDP